MTGLLAVASLALVAAPNAKASVPLPGSMAALGDSISQAYDACCSYGDHPAYSWSTGNDASDGISSHYERIAALNPTITGHQYNDAVTGSKAANLPTQVSNSVAQNAQYVTILIGANDLCTSSASTMTSTANFQSQVAAALASLEQGLPTAEIFVSSIPNIYQLWSALHTNFFARTVWGVAGICQSMLSASNTETQRQQVVTREQAFNQILQQTCGQYANCRWDNYATYNYKFAASQVSTLDYFHPNRSGQAALATVTWNASWWAA